MPSPTSSQHPTSTSRYVYPGSHSENGSWRSGSVSSLSSVPSSSPSSSPPSSRSLPPLLTPSPISGAGRIQVGRVYYLPSYVPPSSIFCHETVKNGEISGMLNHPVLVTRIKVDADGKESALFMICTSMKGRGIPSSKDRIARQQLVLAEHRGGWMQPHDGMIELKLEPSSVKFEKPTYVNTGKEFYIESQHLQKWMTHNDVQITFTQDSMNRIQARNFV